MKLFLGKKKEAFVIDGLEDISLAVSDEYKDGGSYRGSSNVHSSTAGAFPVGYRFRE